MQCMRACMRACKLVDAWIAPSCVDVSSDDRRELAWTWPRVTILMCC